MQPATGDDVPPEVNDLEFIRRIGRGAYGVVWLAREATTLRAVKVLYRRDFEDPKAFDRAFSGVRKFEQICGEHSGFVAIKRIGPLYPVDYFYYVMELADNANASDVKEYVPSTLETELRGKDGLPVPVESCAKLGIEVTRALEALHALKLVHCDIKPANLIYVSHGESRDRILKLADIDLVAAANDARARGTPGYEPPEGPGRVPGDIYSLGRVLFRMVTGQPVSAVAILPPDFFKTQEREARKWLLSIINKACEKEPANRYQSACELRDALGKCIVDVQSSRRTWVVGALGVGVLACAFGGYWHWSSKPSEANGECLLPPEAATVRIPFPIDWSPADRPLSVELFQDGRAAATFPSASSGLLVFAENAPGLHEGPTEIRLSDPKGQVASMVRSVTIKSIVRERPPHSIMVSPQEGWKVPATSIARWWPDISAELQLYQGGQTDRPVSKSGVALESGRTSTLREGATELKLWVPGQPEPDDSSWFNIIVGAAPMK